MYIGSDLSLTNQIHKAAHCGDEPILIEGETGTGKELVAHLIHILSTRKGHPFVPISCAELAPALTESELFGHEKGSFTGALYQKKGIFKAADQGTVFLDELDELDTHQQAKLLRFLQEKEVRAVGSEKSEKVNVRVLCATNQSVSERIYIIELASLRSPYHP
jgi:transcriptional regulator with PAS, ATPase and Fis domain